MGQVGFGEYAQVVVRRELFPSVMTLITLKKRTAVGGKLD